MHQMDTDFYANICIGSHCNLRCPYCFANPLKPPREWPPETRRNMEKLRSFADATGRWTLEFSGGEPTIYPDFGPYCVSLAEAGHRVMFYTNGVKPLAELFPGDSIRAISRVTFSLHVAHQQSDALRATFDRNLEFLAEHGIPRRINYVLYPDRNEEPAAVRRHFEDRGVTFSFRVFQGKYQGKEYPYDYSEEEKAAFETYGEVQSRFLIEHGNYMSTFKPCRAGHNSFYIDLNTGFVSPCEQLQQQRISDVYADDAVARFQAKVRKKPLICSSKRCLCRYTIEQEEFIASHDTWDMANYPEWERISLPTEKALVHWAKREKAFVEDLVARLDSGPVFFWGGGVHTIALLRVLKEQGFPLERARGIIDSNPLQHGRQIAGIPVSGPEVLDTLERQDAASIIISSRAFEGEIQMQIMGSYGSRFRTIGLYDGTLQHQFEAVN